MSTRTRINKNSKPGASSKNKPSGFDRRKSHKSLRRAVNMKLVNIEDPDDFTLPRPVHSTTAAEHDNDQKKTVEKKKFKVWKTKAWKRRNNVRAEKARAYKEIASQDTQDIEDIAS